MWRMPRAAFSISEPGATSKSTSTRVRRSDSLWNVTTPVWLMPSVTRHLMRSSGVCSRISALNSLDLPQILALNVTCVGSSWDTRSTRCMNFGHSSNCVNWL